MRTTRRAGSLALVLALCGCGAGRTDLSGEVTLDGKPLEEGAILLEPTDPAAGTSTGGAIRNGRYSLTGAQAPKPGTYLVKISANRKTGRKVQKAMGRPGELDDELAEAVATRFNSKTELRVEVTAGPPPANFAVTSR